MSGSSIADILSIQLYSLRNYADLDRQLDALAEIGFRHVETVGGHLADARGTRAKLDARGLSAPTGHVGMADLRTRPDWVADQAKAVGIEQLFMPAVPPEERDLPADRWRAVGGELAGMAEAMAAHGITLGYHNHHWELKPKDGNKTALELIFEEAQGTPLAWQVDVAWLVRGGVDPKAWIHRYRDLVASAHVKDIAPQGRNEDQDGWADVGAGTLDWRDLWRACRAAGARTMVVEHDKPADPAETARASFAFLRTVED